VAAGAVVLKFLGDTQSLEASFKKVQAGASNVESSAKKTSTGFQKLGTAAKVASVAILGTGAALIKGFVTQALQGQQAQARLETALRNTHLATTKNKAAIEAYTSSQVKRGFSDDAVTDALSREVIRTHSVTDALKLNNLAADIARAKNVDLATAVGMAIKVHEGNTKVLKQLGIVIQPVTAAVDALKASHDKYTPAALAAAKAADKMSTTQQGLNAALQATHGQADAFASTDAGKIEVFKASWEHLQETIGQRLLPILGQVIDKFSAVLDWVGRNKYTVGLLIGVLAGLATAVWAVNAAVKAWAAVQTALDVVLAANPIGVIVIAVAALAAGLVLAWKRSATFRDIARDAFGVVKTIAYDVRDAVMAVVHAIQTAYDTVKNIVTLGGNLPNAPFSGSHGQSPAKIRAGIGSHAGVGGAVVPGQSLVKTAKELIPGKQQLQEWGASVGPDIATGIMQSQPKVTAALSSAVRGAITNAKQSLTNIGQTFAGMIGQAVDATSAAQLKALGSGAQAQQLAAINATLQAHQDAAQKQSLMDAVAQATDDASRKVAQQALDDWMLQQQANMLSASLQQQQQAIQDQAQARKDAATQGIADLTDQLNRGLIKQQAFNDGIKAILLASGVDYANIGTLLGSSFANAFSDQLAGLRAQMNAIISGPTAPGSGGAPSIVSPAQTQATDLAASVAKAAKTAADAFKFTIPKFQHGTDYVPNTGLAILHRGERVIPAGRSAGGGSTYHLTVNALDPGSAATAVIRAISIYEQRNGQRFARA
jgi:hypothetical protein